jgi:hypothetical protein
LVVSTVPAITAPAAVTAVTDQSRPAATTAIAAGAPGRAGHPVAAVAAVAVQQTGVTTVTTVEAAAPIPEQQPGPAPRAPGRRRATCCVEVKTVAPQQPRIRMGGSPIGKPRLRHL